MNPALAHSPCEGVIPCCRVVELRRYTLRPGKREALIDLFDREFVETQEAAGIRVIAQFRDIDQPDVFTWIRGFSDMTQREAALSAFYDGPVWARHKDAANATMIDSDNVRLLRPATPGSGFAVGERRLPGDGILPPPLLAATIYTLTAAAAPHFSGLFHEVIAPRVIASGTRLLGAFETEPSPNTFPRLPVREGEHAFVWFAQYDDVTAYQRSAAALRQDPRWSRAIAPALGRKQSAPMEVWRLAPTARSRRLHVPSKTDEGGDA